MEPAGKDRTGVAIALILALAGVPQEAIVHDYTLTRIGIEPVRKLLQAKLAGSDGEVDWEDKGTRMLAGCGLVSLLLICYD
jgi:protein tyrosine/serine phosphatase